ncbi:MAG: [protein-PII] uridylyltransferase [Pirellulales bacterium]
MLTAPRLRPSVLEARSRLADGHDKLRQRHAAGSPGIQVSNALTDLVDGVILDLHRSALEDLPQIVDAAQEQIAIVALGGHARRDLAPYSDVDLMLLHAPHAGDAVALLADRLLRDVYDSGLILGQSVRTIAQACQLASRDASVCTSLLEARHLAGSQALFDRFVEQFRKQVGRNWRRLLAATEQARREERHPFGETVYLLEPNIKRSPGGLRDLHLLRWVGFIRYGAADPDGLQLMGELAPSDARALRRAYEFLLRLRNELHFQAGKAQDLLDRTEQLRIAGQFGYQGSPAMLPVEQFMQDYFRATSDVSHVVQHFTAQAQPGHRLRAFLAPLLSHRVEGDYLVGPTQIKPTKRGAEKLRASLSEALRLIDLANLYDKRLSFEACEVIRKAAPGYPPGLSGDSAARFLSLLAQPARLGELLRTLHDVRLLERIIPEFGHARCLLQFNEYHKYTVDEHSLRAVERVVDLKRDRGPLGRVYRGIKQKRVLHLALLIHDLGKGHIEDHSEVGLRIAEETGRRLYLPPAETELLKFLVHKHLVMAHLAFRRDTSDDQLVVRFAVEVGSPEALQMLVCLTAADLAAVGPGVWNKWKGEVLIELYRRTLAHLAGDGSASFDRRLERRRVDLVELVRNDPQQEWLSEQINSLPHEYLTSTPPAQIVAELRELRGLQPRDIFARGQYLAPTRTVEFTVGAHEGVAPGIFHRLTGALTGQGLQILSAQINTLDDHLVLDRFWVLDPDYEDAPPGDRIESVCDSLRQALTGPDSELPKFRRVWNGRPGGSLTVLPTRVRTDNSTSDRFTIIDVFAADRQGLLYRITRALFELGLSVSLAKIATHLDQVLDVFYVTDQRGRKIEEPRRVEEIEARLLAEIEALEAEEAEQVHRV